MMPDDTQQTPAPVHDPVLSLAYGDGVPEPEEVVLARLEMGVRKNLPDNDPRKYFPKPTPLNVQQVLALDSRWVERIRLNAFSGEVWSGMPGEDLAPLTDTLVTRIVVWLESVYQLKTTEARVGLLLNVIAEDQEFHPVVDYLEGLTWDGVERLDQLLPKRFGAEDTELHRAMGRCWLISAVARVMRPGCKVDTTLVLVGAQGKAKSKACAALVPDRSWFSDTILDLRTKDLYEAIQGVWIYEMAEVDAFRKADWARVKSMLSSPSDRWRRPYGRVVQSRERQVVFIASTNEPHFLSDPTGSRRFWPVRIHGVVPTDEGPKVDIQGIEADRDQLWAEALHRFARGEPWWLAARLEHELRESNEDFQEQDPWMGLVDEWSTGKTHFATREVLEHAIKKPRDQWTRGDEMRVSHCLRRLGFDKARIRIAGKPTRVWKAP